MRALRRAWRGRVAALMLWGRGRGRVVAVVVVVVVVVVVAVVVAVGGIEGFGGLGAWGALIDVVG